jgi:hypothetical protein
LNGLPLWANTLGTQLKDGAGQTIAGAYTWGGAQTFSASNVFNASNTFVGNTWSGAQAGTFNITGTFQVGGITLTLPVTVPNGGTGLATLTAHAPQIGNGAGTVTQGGVGTAGQPWISGGAGADPSFQTSATLQGAPANPTGTASASAVMMGLGVTTCKLTPVFSSRVLLRIYGTITNSGANSNSYQARFGTGAAPVNGVAATGTTVGSAVTQAITTGAFNFLFDSGGIITGLTPGVAIWFDVTLSATAGTASMTNISCSAMEF